MSGVCSGYVAVDPPGRAWIIRTMPAKLFAPALPHVWRVCAARWKTSIRPFALTMSLRLARPGCPRPRRQTHCTGRGHCLALGKSPSHGAAPVDPHGRESRAGCSHADNQSAVSSRRTKCRDRNWGSRFRRFCGRTVMARCARGPRLKLKVLHKRGSNVNFRRICAFTASSKAAWSGFKTKFNSS